MTGVFRYALPGYLLLIVAGLLAILALRCAKAYRLWFFALSFLLLPLMCYRARVAGEETWRIVSHATPYLMFALIFVGGDERLWRRLNKVFLMHTLIGSILMMLDLLALSHGAAALSRTVFYTSESNLFLFSELLYGFPFLLLTWDIQSTRGKAIAVLGACVFAAAGIIGQFRGMFFFGFLFYIPFTILITTWHRGRRLGGTIATFARAGLAASIVLVVLLLLCVAMPASTTRVLLGSFDELVHRSDKTIVSESGSWRDEPRWKEMTQEVLPQLTGADWLLGRGVAFRYTYLTWYSTRTVVHMTPIHLVMQGGAPLLILMLLGPVLAGLKRFRRREDIVVLAAACILLNYFASFVAGANPVNKLWFVLVCLCMGRCVTRRKLRQSSTACYGGQSLASSTSQPAPEGGE